jgi:hypothetical protein
MPHHRRQVVLHESFCHRDSRCGGVDLRTGSDADRRTGLRRLRRLRPAPCTGPVPTVDEVVALFARLTDPNIPAVDKNDVVTPGFSPDEAATIDDHLHRSSAAGDLPLTFVITNIQLAPDNFAGATMATTGAWTHQRTSPGPFAMAHQDGHWLLIHQSAMSTMDAIWHAATRCLVVATVRHCPH